MAYIQYREEEKGFVLKTENSEYQMQIGAYGYLLHLYYGRLVGDTFLSGQIVKKDRGFSGNPSEAGGDRTFSLDLLLQEYAGLGNGDYRTGALELLHLDGSNIADLRYVSHRIYEGKYMPQGLPAVHAEKEEAETLEITMQDKGSGAQVVLFYSVLPKQDVITRSVKISNLGTEEFSVKRAMSAQIDFGSRKMELIHFYGRHGMERLMERQPLYHGIQSVGSVRGTSSHQHNPFLIFCDLSATEDYGECYGISLLYSGNFLAEAEVDQIDQIRAVMGIHPENFCYTLKTGEEFHTPEIMLAYSDQGLTGISKIFHNTCRKHVCRGSYAGKRRPVLVNNWEATYFDFNEEKLYAIAKTAREIGIEMLVMDDGWFGNRNSDESGLGDWTVNTEKLKGGLPKLVERVNALGLEFGIWVEPEMISEDSALYRSHPDWCMQIKGRAPSRGRSQLNLDITRKEVRNFILDSLFAVLDSCRISYVKWDMNRSLANVASAALPSQKQGEVYHRYVLALYEMQERLLERYPGLLLENCSGGGGRFDGGMLYYSPQIWCSDNTDAIERLKIQYGTSFGYPVSAAGSHVSACPNHQTGRTTPFETRGIVARSGTFGYELDLERLSPEEKKLASQQIEEYKRLAPLVLNGDYYRLTSPYGEERYILWQFVSKDKREACVEGVQRSPEYNAAVRFIRLKGLEEKLHYRIEGENKIYTGAALMYAGIALPDLKGDYQPVHFYIRQAE